MTIIALEAISLIKLSFIIGGLTLLIPTMLVEDPQPYWLFLLAFSIPFDISKMLTSGIVDPQDLVDQFGMPASGNVSIELYLTDVVLFAMLIPWVAQVCLKRKKFYFPRIGFIIVFYLIWSVFVSMINSESFYLSIVDLWRELLYFLTFVYLINNLPSRLHFRIILAAVFVTLTIGAGTVIGFFFKGIGTETIFFSALHDNQPNAKTAKASEQKLTLHGGGGSELKRSQGMFRHPGVAASFCSITLPIVLAYFLAVPRIRDRLLLAALFGEGASALVLTFSRAGMFGFMVGSLVLLLLAGWSRLIPRRLFADSLIVIAVVGALAVPAALAYFETRPESYSMRFDLFKVQWLGYQKHPFLGVGLNNGTAAMVSGKQEMWDRGVKLPQEESADNHYLVLLAELGPVGFILFFAFFINVALIALRTIPHAEAEVKPLLVGIVAAMCALATQNTADDALAGHAIAGTLWMYAAVVLVLARQTHEKQAIETKDLIPLELDAVIAP